MNRTAITAGLAFVSLCVSLVGGGAAAASPTRGAGVSPVAVGLATVHDSRIADSIARSGKSSGVVAAGGGWNRCPNSYICLFDGFNGQGKMAYFRWGSPNLAGQGFDNITNSYWERTRHGWYMYDFTNYREFISGGSTGGGAYNLIGYSVNRASSLKPY